MNLRRDHILPLAVSPLSWSPVLRTAASSSHETVKKVPLPPPISPEISPLAPPSAASSTSLASPAHPLTNSRPGRPADDGLDGSTRTFPPPERGRTETASVWPQSRLAVSKISPDSDEAGWVLLEIENVGVHEEQAGHPYAMGKDFAGHCLCPYDTWSACFEKAASVHPSAELRVNKALMLLIGCSEGARNAEHKMISQPPSIIVAD